MKVKKYGENRKKTDILKRLENIFFWLGSISIIVLIVFLFIKLTDNQSQPPKRLNDKKITQYELQGKHLISLSSLVNNPKIHSFFTDLLTTYAEKFAKSKELDISHLPLKFEGFYTDENTGKGQGEMGRCFPREIIYPHYTTEINISLNRLYLLNKFGVDKYFASNPEQSGDYSYTDISFSKMLETISHELSHYIQVVVKVI